MKCAEVPLAVGPTSFVSLTNRLLSLLPFSEGGETVPKNTSCHSFFGKILGVY